MSQHSQTRTVKCPSCGDGIPGVKIEFSWVPEAKPSWGYDGGDPGNPAYAEDVEVPEITCEECGHVFTEAERDAIADSFEPEYEGPDEYEPDDYCD